MQDAIIQSDQPAFEEVIWSRPEQKRQKGKVLLVGGHSYSFGEVSKAYQGLEKIKSGEVQMILPESLSRTIPPGTFPITFFSANSTGSFSIKDKPKLLNLAGEYDCTVFPGDLGRNSESAQLVASVIERLDNRVVISGDALNQMLHQSQTLLDRENLVIVANLGQIQQLFKNAGVERPVLAANALPQIVEALKAGSLKTTSCIVMPHESNVVAACGGEVSITKSESELELATLTGALGGLLAENHANLFETVTTAIYLASK